MKARWLMAIVWVAGCKSAPVPAEAPVVAEQFLNAFVDRNFDKAGNWCTRQSRTNLEGLSHDLSKFSIHFDSAYANFWLDTISVDSMWLAVVWDTTAKWIDTTRIPMVIQGKRWKVVYHRFDPIGVARQFLHAFHSSDLQRARQWATPAAQRDLDLLEELYASWSGPETVISDIRYTDDGRSAIVYYREAGSLVEKKINLVIRRGMWRVAFTKIPGFEP